MSERLQRVLASVQGEMRSNLVLATFTASLRSYRGHWLWRGTVATDRGRVRPYLLTDKRDRSGRYNRMHAARFAWQLERGPIPENTDLSRTCSQELCVNPAHHQLRQHAGAGGGDGVRCQRGHVDWGRNATDGRRFCRTCKREANRARKRRAVAVGTGVRSSVPPSGPPSGAARIPRVKRSSGLQDQARVTAMVVLRDKGLTLQEIGNSFGISRERVRQILTSYEEKSGVKLTTSCRLCGSTMERHLASAYCSTCLSCRDCGKPLPSSGPNSTRLCRACRHKARRRVGPPTQRVVEPGIYRVHYPATGWDGDYMVHINASRSETGKPLGISAETLTKARAIRRSYGLPVGRDGRRRA